MREAFVEYVVRDTEADGSVRFAKIAYQAEERLDRIDLRDRMADAGDAFCHKYSPARKMLTDIGGFDIGDLRNYVDYPLLQKEFCERGLYCVRVTITDFAVPLDDEWHYDCLLVEEPPVGELSMAMKDELDAMDLAELMRDYRKIVADDPERTLGQWADSVIHGVVTCKYDTTIPCTAEMEEMASAYLFARLGAYAKEKS